MHSSSQSQLLDTLMTLLLKAVWLEGLIPLPFILVKNIILLLCPSILSKMFWSSFIYIYIYIYLYIYLLHP